MKKIISIITLTFLSINSLFSQDCPSLNFESEITGNTLPILITTTALGGDVLNGDKIGVFYTNDDGDLVCGGFSFMQTNSKLLHMEMILPLISPKRWIWYWGYSFMESANFFRTL